MSRPFGSTHMQTQEPWVFFGTEYSSSTLNPLATFIVAGSVAGGSFGWAEATPAVARRATSADSGESGNRGIGEPPRRVRRVWEVYPRPRCRAPAGNGCVTRSGAGESRHRSQG